MSDPSQHDPPKQSGLQTEFYHLVQSALYHADGMWGDATVDLYFTDMPPDHGFMIAAGIQPAIDAILSMRFTEAEIEWLQGQEIYAGLGPTYFDSLRHFSFGGDIWAVREGTPVVPDEPVVRITAPLPQIGLFELILTQTISLASSVATQADRLVRAADGRPVLDFGSRRYGRNETATAAARAAAIGGCSGTSHAHAARVLDLPAVGLISDTMLAAYDDVAIAFQALRAHFPEGGHVNLPPAETISSIDRLQGIRNHVRAVRIDSEDLSGLSHAVRARLDELGMVHTQILGSGRLDPHRIAALVAAAAPIDGYAVSGALGIATMSSGAPMSYRMAELVRGTTPSPVTGHWSAPWPGRKQVLRFPDHDELAVDFEADSLGGQPLLRPWVEAGQRVREAPRLPEMCSWCRDAVAAMPESVLRLRDPAKYPVHATRSLRRMAGVEV